MRVCAETMAVGTDDDHVPVGPACTIPGSERITVRSAQGLAYDLMIAHPVAAPAQAAGYPVLYLLDGNAIFGTAAELVGLRSRRPEATGIVPAVVVAIGYPGEMPLDLERRAHDYTPPASTADLPPRPDASRWASVGGADAFLAFILDVVRPLVAQKFPVDPRQQALFGHSFGGLFALHALFTRPQAFSHYIAASPSIWWYQHALRDDESEFVQRARSSGVDARLLITIGALEQRLTAIEAESADFAIRAQWKQRNRMVDNARELAARLAELRGCGLAASFAMFDGEDHTSVLPAALGRAVSFALGRQP